MLGNYPSRVGRAGRLSHLQGHIWHIVFIQIGQRLNPGRKSLTEWNKKGEKNGNGVRPSSRKITGRRGEIGYLRVVPAETV